MKPVWIIIAALSLAVVLFELMRVAPSFGCGAADQNACPAGVRP